jgi:hypothetical protein
MATFRVFSGGSLASLYLLLALGVASAVENPNQLTAAEQSAGWRLLFDGVSTQGWHAFKQPGRPVQGWEVQEGWLHCRGKGGADAISEQQFEQFELTWEWKLEASGNSGLKYFVVDTRSSPLGHEYQMQDDPKDAQGKVIPGKHITASFYDVLKPTATLPAKPPGEINQSRILVQGNHVEHWLNGVRVLSYDCGSEAVQQAVADSKFKTTAGFGIRLKGHLLLQNHGTPVWFRGIKIRDLSGRTTSQAQPR